VNTVKMSTSMRRKGPMQVKISIIGDSFLLASEVDVKKPNLLGLLGLRPFLSNGLLLCSPAGEHEFVLH